MTKRQANRLYMRRWRKKATNRRAERKRQRAAYQENHRPTPRRCYNCNARARHTITRELATPRGFVPRRVPYCGAC
jgi:hypothetical protein